MQDRSTVSKQRTKSLPSHCPHPLERLTTRKLAEPCDLFIHSFAYQMPSKDDTGKDNRICAGVGTRDVVLHV